MKAILDLLGQHGHFHYSLRLAFLSLALLVVLWYVGRFVWLIAKAHGAERQQAARHALGQLRAIGPKLDLVLMFGAAMFGSGILWRDHQLASNRVTYTDVYVVAKLSIDRFVMQPARMQPIPSTLCHSQVDWQAGETLQDWTFEQMQGCKRVISYHRYLRGEIHAGD